MNEARKQIDADHVFKWIERFLTNSFRKRRLNSDCMQGNDTEGRKQSL